MSNDVQMVENNTYEEVIERIFPSIATNEETNERTLLKELYSSYLNLYNQGNEKPTLRRVPGRSNCETLWRQYSKKYRGLTSGEKGFRNKRTVSEKQLTDVKYAWTDETYYFDRKYEKKTFIKYLMEEEARTADPAFFSFLIHMAVAFTLPPEKTDELLRKYGFHPLHAKNLHHIAIYSVLRYAQTQEWEAYNPFADIKNLFFAAWELLSSPTEGTAEIFVDDGEYNRRFEYSV